MHAWVHIKGYREVYTASMHAIPDMSVFMHACVNPKIKMCAYIQANFIPACAASPAGQQGGNVTDLCTTCYSNFTAALLNHAQLAGKIVLVQLAEVRCISSFSSIVDVLATVDAVGVLFGGTSNAIFHMSEKGGYTSRIPAFSVRQMDATWILDRLSPGTRRVATGGGGGEGAKAADMTGGYSDGSLARRLAGEQGVSAFLPKIEKGVAPNYRIVTGELEGGCPVPNSPPVQVMGEGIDVYVAIYVYTDRDVPIV